MHLRWKRMKFNRTKNAKRGNERVERISRDRNWFDADDAFILSCLFVLIPQALLDQRRQQKQWHDFQLDVFPYWLNNTIEITPDVCVRTNAWNTHVSSNLNAIISRYMDVPGTSRQRILSPCALMHMHTNKTNYFIANYTFYLEQNRRQMFYYYSKELLLSGTNGGYAGSESFSDRRQKKKTHANYQHHQNY